MDTVRGIAFSRAVYTATVFVLFGIMSSLFILFSGSVGGSDCFSAEIDKVERMQEDGQADESLNLAQPDFAYESIKLTTIGSLRIGSMLGSESYGTVNSILADKGADYFFSDIRNITACDDMTCGMLESVISDSTTLEVSQSDSTGISGWYRAGERMTGALVNGGIDVLSVENDGVYSWGDEGFYDTTASLNEYGIRTLTQDEPLGKIMPNGTKLALYTCKYGEENILSCTERLQSAANSTDRYDIVYVTGVGGGYDTGEDEIKLMHSLIDSGAELVVATNSKCLKKAEEYGDGYIVYSLGSLIDGSEKYGEKCSVLLQTELRCDNGRILEAKHTLHPVYCYENDDPWKPVFVIDSEESEKIIDFMNGKTEHP